MKVITKPILKALEARGIGNEYSEDDAVIFKLFNPYGKGTWYVMEGEEFINDDGRADWRFFGLCEIDYREFGYFHLNELLDVDVLPPWNGSIERDRHYKGTYGDLINIQGEVLA